MTRPTEDQMKKMFITPSIFDRLVKWGWVRYSGSSLQWWEHQRPGHDNQFQEPRERKAPKKFQKKNNGSFEFKR